MTTYIDAQRDRFGVEPICRVLQFAPATYYAAKSPASRQPGACVTKQLKAEIMRVWNEHRRVYGADKVWAQLNREGVRVARCTVERLMRDLGIRGVVRGKTVRTTFADDGSGTARRPGRPPVPRGGSQPPVGGRPDLREDPLRLGLRGLHHRRLLPLCRRLAGVALAAHRPRPRRPGDGDLWARRGEHLDGLVHHSDRGVQYRRHSLHRAPRRGRRRSPPWARAATPTTTRSPKSFNGLYKAELIHRRPGGLDDVEYETLDYVDWFNHRRLHGEIGMVPPAEFEADLLPSVTPQPRWLGTQ